MLGDVVTIEFNSRYCKISHLQFRGIFIDLFCQLNIRNKHPLSELLDRFIGLNCNHKIKIFVSSDSEPDRSLRTSELYHCWYLLCYKNGMPVCLFRIKLHQSAYQLITSFLHFNRLQFNLIRLANWLSIFLFKIIWWLIRLSKESLLIF